MHNDEGAKVRAERPEHRPGKNARRRNEEREDDVERTGEHDKKKMSRHAKVAQVRVGERSSVERT